MTDAALSKNRIVAALAEEWDVIAELMGRQTDDTWNMPTKSLPGWTVKDVVAHIIGTESSLSGEIPPPAKSDLKALDHVNNDIAALNEQWVDSMRDLSPSVVLSRFSAVTKAREQALEAMTLEEFDAPSWTPAGQATYARFMQIRVYDCWLHEQDIRDTLDHPGHETGAQAEIVVDEITTALGYIVGKKAAAPEGSRVTFEITGGVKRTINVLVEDRAKVVASLGAPADVVLTMTSHLLARLAGGRVDPEQSMGEIDMRGDVNLGERIVKSLPFTI
jgi:uncharacterized protein (TIGR03083 family)